MGLAFLTLDLYNVYMNSSLIKKSHLSLISVLVFLLIFLSTSLTISVYAQESAKKEESVDKNPKYISESVRARLSEARKCVKENPGNSWNECRYSCVDICNEIEDTYSRGLCNGVLVQICCGQFPNGCK
jgi:hypothetical protein